MLQLQNDIIRKVMEKIKSLGNRPDKKMFFGKYLKKWKNLSTQTDLERYHQEDFSFP